MEKVDTFLAKTKKWQEEMTLLRKLCLDCGLTEDFKWKHPCYTFQGKNIVLIHGFKAYCALLFYKGALLADTRDLLVQQTENVQSARQLRFTNKQEIAELENTIKAYIFEAIEVEKAGLEVKMKDTSEFDIPEELQIKFNADSNFETAFQSLTPGRQRGYLLYFSQAKQSKTRTSRIEKYAPKIFKGKGLNDT
ncbi:YdeI/OmpD-associated family protein [Snuella sedimenti]|uniref:YdeI family protein n=1 Tax=Snuella sedimenti TaxID=2798802 RepID=A0A8J7J030_9FLAO|nr:YdeI family protein [Snuella sedimenti]MBJ6367027.1 YdeI family protein [Snuella sedimenti]